VSTVAFPLGRAALPRRGEGTDGADRVRSAVLSWEGVTVRDGRARLGLDDLGRLPRRVWNVERAIERFRKRYERAADLLDRRAGVPA
jgi:hypothetical protein